MNFLLYTLKIKLPGASDKLLGFKRFFNTMLYSKAAGILSTQIFSNYVNKA